MQDVAAEDVVTGARAVGDASLRAAASVNPLQATCQLCNLYSALQLRPPKYVPTYAETWPPRHATRHPSITLLSVGNLFPVDEQQLNVALHSCLWQAMRALGDAAEVMHAYVQYGWAGRLRFAGNTKK